MLMSDYQAEELHTFYPAVPSLWIKPTMSNLRHLTIYSSFYFGYYPKFDLRGIHLPQLRTLSFGNYCFVHDSQLEWILSHGSTLTELYLDDCPILFEVSTEDKYRTYLDPEVYETLEFDEKEWACYESRWCDYFQAFEDGLPHLREFRYGSSPNWWEDDSVPFESETEMKVGLNDESYMTFCYGYGPSPYMKSSIYTAEEDYEDGDPSKPTDEDWEALRDLYAKLGQATRIPDFSDHDSS